MLFPLFSCASSKEMRTPGSGFELRLIELPVGAPACHQLIMAALFGDAVLGQHQNPVGMPDGGEAVGDNERGASLGQAAQ